MQPYVVSKTLDSEGNVVSQTQPIEKRQVISESTSEKIMASMEQVALNDEIGVTGIHKALGESLGSVTCRVMA